MKVIIMAGGAGTRFWPISTEVRPKQFLNLTSGQTMIQETYSRFRKWLPPEQIYVVTIAEFMPLILEQLPEINSKQIIIEPCRRDSGPCLALTALHFLDQGDDEVLVTAPSDQYIPDGEALEKVLLQAEEAARKDGVIATLGIVPTRPETGYGYIDAEEAPSWDQTYKVNHFVEKPSLEKAKEMLRKSNIYWNSGIFIWKPSTIGYYMSVHQQEMWNKLTGHKGQLSLIYPDLPKISVDYAILEKAEKVYMIPFPSEWDDVGTWTSLNRIHAVDEVGNMTFGEVHILSASNNIIWAENQKMAVIGVTDLIIVSTREGLLVCHKSQEQAIKKIVQSL